MTPPPPRCPPIFSLSHPYIPLVLTTSSETGSLTGPGYGELILWRVSCIGPMTTRKTGILELARVDTKRAADFTAVSITWLPGYLVTWFPGFLVTWLPGYLVTWLPGAADFTAVSNEYSWEIRCFYRGMF